MRTEKNQLTLRDENLSVMKSTSKRLNTFFNKNAKFKKLILKHRETTRTKILATELSWPTILALFPLGLGMVQFFLTTTSSFNRDVFFRKTLPVFSKTYPKYTTETLDYILNSNSSCANENRNFVLSQPLFLAQLKKSSTPSFKVKSFLDFEEFTGLSSSFFDELPSYMEGLKQNLKNPKQENTQDLGLFENTDWQKTSLSKNKESSFPKNSHFSPLRLMSTATNEKEKTLQCVFSSLQENVIPSTLTNSFFKERLEWLKGEDELTQELGALFLEKEFSVCADLNEETSESLVFDGFAKQNNSINETVLVDTLLKNSKIWSQFSGENSRIMSGYTYPDMTSQDLVWFLKEKTINKFLFKTSSTELDTRKLTSPWVPNTGDSYLFRVKNLPQIRIQARQVTVAETTKDKILYTGPSILLNKKTAYDWKTSNKLSLRGWFHQYLSPLNPFTQHQENFFGNFESPFLSKDYKEKKLAEFKNTEYFQEVYESRPPSSFYRKWLCVPPKGGKNLVTPLVSTFVIPRRLQNPMARILTIPVQNTQGENVRTYTLPILQIRQPLQAFQTGDTEKKVFTDKIYSSRFDLGVTAKPDFQFSAECWTYTPSIQSSSVSGTQYFRSKLLFTENLNKAWGELWEPLSTESWLLLCQISFGTVAFQLVKLFLQNYGREAVSFLLALGSNFGVFEKAVKEYIELVLGERTPGYRIVSKTTKSFQDVVGVEQFLPDLYELLWFLRNGRESDPLDKRLETIPRGVLLTGPPGTGKTLLVKAIAGEARVPVIVLSGSSLMQPNESASAKLNLVFDEARFHAPCIVFIDELDSLGHRRRGLVYSPMEHDKEVLTAVMGGDEPASSHSHFTDFEQDEIPNSEKSSALKDQEFLTPEDPKQISLLTKLLIELDGMQARDGIIVFAATNRPDVLDPALLRAGRFDKFIHVGVPDHEKRIEILQFYGKKRGFADTLPWEYVATRTLGFSAADLATLMNESAMKAIMSESQHTVETIEHGLDRLTTSEIEKITPRVFQTPDGSKTLLPLSVSQKLEIVRLAYYQSAKVLVTAFLPHHPKSVVASLWPRRPTLRSLQLATNLRSNMFQSSRLYELHDRVVGCYAGKAAEILFVQKFSTRRSSHLSTLGVEELLFAQKLSLILIEKAQFYSKKTQLQRTLPLAQNVNAQEFPVDPQKPQKLNEYDDLLEKLCFPAMQDTLNETTSEHKSLYDIDFDLLNPEFRRQSEQLYFSVPWWQLNTSLLFTGIEKNPGNWTDFYLFNPELTKRNVQWLPPDDFYHTETSLKYLRTALLNLKTTSQTSEGHQSEKEKTYPNKKVNLPWNEVSKITRDYPIHSLVSQSFNKAFKILNRNRALLDRLAINLISNELLREPEITTLFNEFQKNAERISAKHSQFETYQAKQQLIQTFEKEQQIKIIEFSWGRWSRKVLPRWIDFSAFETSEN